MITDKDLYIFEESWFTYNDNMYRIDYILYDDDYFSDFNGNYKECLRPYIDIIYNILHIYESDKDLIHTLVASRFNENTSAKQLKIEQPNVAKVIKKVTRWLDKANIRYEIEDILINEPTLIDGKKLTKVIAKMFRLSLELRNILRELSIEAFRECKDNEK